MRRTTEDDAEEIPRRPFNIWDNIDRQDDQAKRDEAS